jgi:hypothetical protein
MDADDELTWNQHKMQCHHPRRLGRRLPCQRDNRVRLTQYRFVRGGRKSLNHFAKMECEYRPHCERASSHLYPTPNTAVDKWMIRITEDLVTDDQGSLGGYVCRTCDQLAVDEKKGHSMETSAMFDHYVERVLLYHAKQIFTPNQIEWLRQRFPSLIDDKTKRYRKLAWEIRNRLTKHGRPGEYSIHKIRRIDFSNEWKDL